VINGQKKIIGITMGDPCGIGPEVIAKALAKPVIRKRAQFKIIGDYNVYQKLGGKLYPNCSFVNIKSKGSACYAPMKKINRAAGQASLNYLHRAIDLLKKKEIAGLVTAPVCKEAIMVTDNAFIGHTEFLARAFSIKNVGMMFVGNQLRVIIVTRHIPLNKISRAITPTKVYETIHLTHQALKNFFKIKNPTIAVCGLNPHAGEGGKMGREEIEKIIPALKKARKYKINVEGPFAADTLFSPGIAHPYDTVVAMYHDQGLIPIKTLYFKNLVNLTIGLPFVRTSPAHGTAFNIAGQNKADPSSMCEAIKLAVELTP